MKKIIVACSGGPDSMALLDQCKDKYSVCVAHVNYKKRDTADRDENIIKTYCSKYDIPVKVLYPTWNHKGNFQAWAREVRYDFFEEVADEFDTKDIYIAHQLDDRIETYLFQKQRNMLCDTYGLNELSNRHGYILHRPLLNYEKQELEMYCINHSIPYGIDESNLTDDYTRNQIRHHQTNTFTKIEKLELCHTIDIENQKLEERRQKAEGFLQEFTVDELVKEEDAAFILDYFINRVTHMHYSHSHLQSLLAQLHTDCLIDLNEYYLECFKNQLYCVKKTEKVKDSFDSIQFGNYTNYELKQEGSTIQGVTLKEDDFPIVIRNVQESDFIQLRFGKKKIHRFFIDRKIPRFQREKWLVVENRKGNVIFVPGIGCDVEHFSVKPNVFMIQWKS